MTPLETNLRSFFEQYARTFHEDIGAFCDLYDFPSETVRLDGTVLRFHTKDEATESFALAKKKCTKTRGALSGGSGASSLKNVGPDTSSLQLVGT